MELQTIEDAMREHDDPVVHVPELADQLDASDTHIRDQLRLLEREGAVGSKDVGARATAWWHEDRVTRADTSPGEIIDHSVQEDLATPDDAHSAEREPQRDGVLDELLDGWHPGRSAEEREPRRAAGRAALEELRNGGQMTRTDFEDALLPEFDVSGQNEKTWWKNSVRPALNRGREEDIVEWHHGPPHRYEWVGE